MIQSQATSKAGGGIYVKCASCGHTRESLHVCEYMMCPACKTVTRTGWWLKEREEEGK